jgi:low temperature requirement protein LtrA
MTHPVPRFTIRTRMSARDAEQQHRSSSPLEALFDLTFVVAVAQVADQLANAIEHGRLVQGIVPFLMVFFAIWWAWMNFTWFASAYDTDDVPYRLLTLLQMGGVLVLAAGVPAAFEHGGFFGITLGYFLMRVGLVAQWVRAAIENPDGRTTALRYAGGVTLVQLGWISRLLLPTNAANQWWTVYLAFVVFVILEFAVPYWAERTGMTTWHPHHIAERYGLFAIILIGEIIAVFASAVGAVLGSGAHVGPLVTAGVSALVLIFALWWLYFLQPTGEGLAADRRGSFSWGYGHYFVFAALGALGAGLEVVVRFSGGHVDVPPEVAAYSVAIPAAVYVLALVITNLRILPGISKHLIVVVPVAVVVLALPLAANAIGLPLVFALTAALVALAVVATMLLGRAYTRTQQ